LLEGRRCRWRRALRRRLGGRAAKASLGEFAEPEPDARLADAAATSPTLGVMVSKARPIVMLLPLAAALVAAGPAQAGERRVPEGFYGVNWNRAGTSAPGATQGRQFRLMARSGVESVRTVFSWAGAQPSAGEPTRFVDTDRAVALAARHGIRLLPIVIYTPTWAARYPERGGSPPARVADFAAYLDALVRRYGPAGTFWAGRPDLPRRPVRQWQIWNEPHFDAYWYAEGESEQSWARGYARLLRAAYDAIKRRDPRAKVVTAALAGFAWNHLAALYREGARGHFDAAALNIFTIEPANVLRGVSKMRALLRFFGEGRKRVWITETTWPAAEGRALEANREDWHFAWQTTPRGMANRLSRLYVLTARYRRPLRIGPVFWYTFATAYKGIDLFDYGGLARFDENVFYPQPALRAYARSARRHQGCRKRRDGRCRRFPPALAERPPIPRLSAPSSPDGL
jgi:hypothetical protein